MVFAGSLGKDKGNWLDGLVRGPAVGAIAAICATSLFALYACRQQFYLAVNSYILWSESLGRIGLLLVGLGMFSTQLLPVPFLFIGLCVTSTFSLGFAAALMPLCLGTCLGLVFTWMLCHSSLRPWITSKFSNTEVMQHLHRELADHHWKIVIVTRLSPLPIGLQNVMLSLLMTGSEALWVYLVGSLAIIIPEIFVYMLAGGTMKDISDFMMGDVELGPWERSLLLTQIVGAVLFFYGIYRYGTRFVDEIYAKIIEIDEQQNKLHSENNKHGIIPKVESIV